MNDRWDAVGKQREIQFHILEEMHVTKDDIIYQNLMETGFQKQR